MTSKAQKLKTEVALPAYAGLSDADAAASINLPGSGTTIHGRLQVIDLKRYMAAEGLLSMLRDEAANGTSADATATASAKSLMELFDEGIPDFNAHHARSQAALDALDDVSGAGLITAAQRVVIEAMGDTVQTRGQEIGVGVVTADDILVARNS